MNYLYALGHKNMSHKTTSPWNDDATVVEVQQRYMRIWSNNTTQRWFLVIFQVSATVDRTRHNIVKWPQLKHDFCKILGIKTFGPSIILPIETTENIHTHIEACVTIWLLVWLILGMRTKGWYWTIPTWHQRRKLSKNTEFRVFFTYQKWVE